MPLFDAYLMVDWSAASTPRLGADSIWLCQLHRDADGLRETRCENIATRTAAQARLLAILEEDCAAGRATLAGFDFPFGYPAGFAGRLAPKEDERAPWLATWRYLSERITDDATNRNNRFRLAADINRRLSKEGGPFWGCPVGADYPGLTARHHRRHDALGLAERRRVERDVKGPQPVWKLYGNGSVGGQALTGIPVVHALRRALRDSAVWPFETGLRPPERTAGRTIFSEIYPSLIRVERRDGEVKDQAQVRAIGRYLAALDEAGALAACFEGDSALTNDERRQVEEEEGWVLGVVDGASSPRRRPPSDRRYDRLRDRRAISAEAVEIETRRGGPSVTLASGASICYGGGMLARPIPPGAMIAPPRPQTEKHGSRF
jgi:hypothetical protein